MRTNCKRVPQRCKRHLTHIVFLSDADWVLPRVETQSRDVVEHIHFWPTMGLLKTKSFNFKFYYSQQ